VATSDDPFRGYELPVGDWAQSLVDWSAVHLRAAFQAVRWPFAEVLDWITQTLTAAPVWVILLVVALLAWQIAGARRAGYYVLGFCFLGIIGVWHQTMITIALLTTAVLFCVIIGLPWGILVAKNRRVEAAVRPVLDVMQTIPTFVYLVPIAMLVGIGSVPGVMATMVFALPPAIRLTALGIQQVPTGPVEAAKALGLKSGQVLLLIELPLALKSIMLGINQTVMMALAMCVTTSMIAADGLGLLVLRGIGSLDMGLATQGGAGIVILGIMLDRLTQSLGNSMASESRWFERGPARLAVAAFGTIRRKPAQVAAAQSMSPARRTH
jgi:glycine betaine/proline transport system permease protein